MLAMCKFKTFANNTFTLVQMVEFFSDGIENYVAEKQEHSGFQHFVLFPQYFQKISFSEP